MDPVMNSDVSAVALVTFLTAAMGSASAFL
jgi:hypothetical protein